MMKPYLLFVFWCLWSFPCPGQVEPTLVNSSHTFTRQQQDSLSKYLEPFPEQSSISLAILEGPQTTFAGFLNNGGTWQELQNQDSVYEIGSISKVFTALLLADLARDSTLVLDDRLVDILPYAVYPRAAQAGEITLKILSNHTSGLPRLPSNLQTWLHPDNPYSQYDTVRLKEYLTQDLTIWTPPGLQYSYSNLGVGLLGYLLELKSGQSYETLLQQRVFLRYSMHSSTSDRSLVSHLLVRGRNHQGRPTSNWDLNVLKGAGGILSTTSDLVKFVRANFSESPELTLIRGETHAINENLAVGMGWHILKSHDKRVFWHNGGTSGYRAFLGFDPDASTGVIVLSNVSAFHPKADGIDALGIALLKTLP